MATKTLHTKAQSLMNPHAPFLPLGPLGRDMAVQLESGQFSGIPVVDQERRVLGIVREESLQRVMDLGEDLANVWAEHVLTVLPTYLDEHMTREEVGSILIRKNVMQLPVLRDGKFVGVVTRWMVFKKNSLLQDSARSRIPGYSGQVNHSDQQPAPYISALETGSMGRVKTILVVDDDPVISGLLCDMLRNMDYCVMAAGNGKEGLSMVYHHHALDGIFLDLDMPIMNGRTMLDELRWKNYDIPVVLMSGEVDHGTLHKLLREGAQGCLMKPFTLKSLQAQCEGVFGPAVASAPFISGPNRKAISHLVA